MKSIEDDAHSFIVRVRLEPRELEGAVSEWRGMIEHVESGERRYLKDLDEITSFIAGYLRKMGVKCSGAGKSRKWIKLWKMDFLGRI